MLRPLLQRYFEEIRVLDLAGVRRAAGEREDVAAAAAEALVPYERKENLVEAERARASSRSSSGSLPA